MARLFGTDGIRGVANQELTPELAVAVGRASALVLGAGSQKPILIGRDPRLSGHMLEGALVAGVTSAGFDVILVGVVPTPAVAFLTRFFDCCAGIMISASHNPVQDNGIKVFDGAGFKLSTEEEIAIETVIQADKYPKPIGEKVGNVQTRFDAGELYLQELQKQVSLDLHGLHIAVDCANGATSSYAAKLFSSLGARVTPFYVEPTGVNINHFCGSTYPEKIRKATSACGADVGFAFDGDGDRVLAVDERGRLIDGDHILAIIGLYLLKRNLLPARKIIATAYSNGGLRQAFLACGGEVEFAPPGDRFVLEMMQEKGCVLGGEQSGHILFLENSTTGDGLLTALKLLEVKKLAEQSLAQLADGMEVFPQRLVNVPVGAKGQWENNTRITNAILEAKKLLGDLGRIFVRESGTEPLIRVLGEHPEEHVLDEAIQLVVETIENEQGKAYVG